ncbi:MAG: hypothetical protein V3W52_17180 [Syntrophobacteria bacterium]
MKRFWERLREYANNKVREHYMNTVRHDRKCVRCNTWTSEVGGAAKLEQDDDYDYMTCKKCGYVSKWDCRGMLPILAKRNEQQEDNPQ